MQDASRIISPQQNQTELDLLKQFGPQFNKIGTDIEGQNQLARGSNDVAALKGPGALAVAETKKLDESLNPEFYKTRADTGAGLSKLVNSFDLSGGLSGGERTEIERSLNKSNFGRGVVGAPTGIGAVSNAMNFGQAGAAKKAQAQAGLTSAINAGSGFLPSSKSGIDPSQVALGRPSQGNSGGNLLPGFQTTGSTAYGLGSQVLNSANSQQTTAANINSQRRSGMDIANQTIASL